MTSFLEWLNTRLSAAEYNFLTQEMRCLASGREKVLTGQERIFLEPGAGRFLFS